MKSVILAMLLPGLWGGHLAAQDACSEVLQGLKLPVKMKTRGKPRMTQWEQIDSVLAKLTEKSQGRSCRLTFGQVFTSDREGLLFPVTNSVLRLAPEDALLGLEVFNAKGEQLGRFRGRVRYDRSGGLYAMESYSLFYFQFEDSEGKLQATGNRLLLGDFGVEWAKVRERVILSQ